MGNKHGFPQAFGCFDGTHMSIMQPLDPPPDYYSYKMKYLSRVTSLLQHTQGQINSEDLFGHPGLIWYSLTLLI